MPFGWKRWGVVGASLPAPLDSLPSCRNDGWGADWRDGSPGIDYQGSAAHPFTLTSIPLPSRRRSEVQPARWTVRFTASVPSSLKSPHPAGRRHEPRMSLTSQQVFYTVSQTRSPQGTQACHAHAIDSQQCSSRIYSRSLRPRYIGTEGPRPRAATTSIRAFFQALHLCAGASNACERLRSAEIACGSKAHIEAA